MKHLKLFEFYKTDIHVGDFVLLSTVSNHVMLLDFINNTAGEIVKIINDEVFIKYYNVPDRIKTFLKIETKDYIRSFRINKIVYVSDNEEDVNAYITTKKYNI